MADKDKEPDKSGPQADPASPGAEGGGDKPPESAEDFDHVLRRLIATRDKLPHGG